MNHEPDPILDCKVAACGTLPQFPDFTPVASLTAQEFSAALTGHLPYSNFNYVSLRTYWPQAQMARLGDGLALLLTDPLTETPWHCIALHCITL